TGALRDGDRAERDGGRQRVCERHGRRRRGAGIPDDEGVGEGVTDARLRRARRLGDGQIGLRGGRQRRGRRGRRSRCRGRRGGRLRAARGGRRGRPDGRGSDGRGGGRRGGGRRQQDDGPDRGGLIVWSGIDCRARQRGDVGDRCDACQHRVGGGD